MILDCDLHERLSALEELMQQQQRATADPMREVNLDDYMQDSLQDSWQELVREFVCNTMTGLFCVRVPLQAYRTPYEGQ